MSQNPVEDQKAEFRKSRIVTFTGMGKRNLGFSITRPIDVIRTLNRSKPNLARKRPFERFTQSVQNFIAT
jgi:hypothetical protein